MKLSPFVLALLPLAAHAQVELKCTSLKASDQIQVSLSFNKSGENGYIQADYWGGAYPFGLVWADLDAAQPAGDRLVFASNEDKHNGAVAKLDLPADFLQANGRWIAQLEVRDPGPKGKIAAYTLTCSHR